jgi:GNAT superfamily N-acetyltransferase
MAKVTRELIVVGRVAEYTPRVAAGIGRLMPILDERFSGAPMPREALEEIIGSPSHDQIIAEHQGQVVGSAVMSLVLGSGFWQRPEGQHQNRKGYLEDFVVDPSMRGVRSPESGLSAADLLWEEMLAVCRDHDAEVLSFASRIEARPDAARFYAKHGAFPMEGARFFEVEVPLLGTDNHQAQGTPNI